MKTIAVYGSLKMGRYNHGMLKDSTYLGESDVKGTMYLISTYPALLEDKEEPKRQTYTIELYEVEDMTYTRIHNMEIRAGYKAVLQDFPLGKETRKAIVFYADKDLSEYCRTRAKIIDSY